MTNSTIEENLSDIIKAVLNILMDKNIISTGEAIRIWNDYRHQNDQLKN